MTVTRILIPHTIECKELETVKLQDLDTCLDQGYDIIHSQTIIGSIGYNGRVFKAPYTVFILSKENN